MSDSIRPGGQGDDGDGAPPERLAEVLRGKPWLDQVVRLGWLSRGIVYVVVGVTTLSVAGQSAPTEDEASPSDPSPGDNDRPRGAMVIGGVVGWLGRSSVIALVGYFVLRAAVTFDADEARGFDRALRRTAGSTLGTSLVFACGVGLVSYGVFCVASHRHRTINDNESD